MALTEWRELAGCVGHSDLFLSADITRKPEREAICAACPVKAECRHEAWNNGEYEHNLMWGGEQYPIKDTVYGRYPRNKNRTIGCQWCGAQFVPYGRAKFCEPCRPLAAQARQQTRKDRVA